MFIIQRQFVCLNYFKNILTDSSLYVAESQVHWKQMIDDWSQESSKYVVKIYPFLGGFTKFQVKNTPISRFREIVFKIPLFSWNLEHTLDHKCPWRVATGYAVCIPLSDDVLSHTLHCSPVSGLWKYHLQQLCIRILLK